MVDRIGTAIAAYRIESLIARGGMGDVYLATQSFRERKVTLKILPHDPGRRGFQPAIRARRGEGPGGPSPSTRHR